jgi:hypothetical protein
MHAVDYGFEYGDKDGLAIEFCENVTCSSSLPYTQCARRL